MTKDVKNFHIDQFNKQGDFGPNDLGKDVVLEAKRVILNEQIDKIVNITLADPSSGIFQYSESHFRDIGCDKFSNENVNLSVNTQKIQKDTGTKINSIFEEKPISNNFTLVGVSKLNPPDTRETSNLYDDNYLKKKYFCKWRERFYSNKSQGNSNKSCKENQDKLTCFIDNIKKKQDELQNKKMETELPQPLKFASSYKNRFAAQKDIIEMQKTKLEEQNKIIEELKLGIIRSDLLKSIENSKSNIREIFQTCSEKLKNKSPLIVASEVREKFMVNTQKVPTVLRKMEQRAVERANNRKIILERRRLIEETRKKLLEEAIEKKRVIEEEERKRNLEIINERRKKELELEKLRQIKKKIYEENLNKSINYHDKLLLRQGFKIILYNLQDSRKKNLSAVTHYKNKIKSCVVKSWLFYVENKYKFKNELADAHLSYKLLKKHLDTWKEYHMDSIRSMQVAEDLYDFRLTSNIFIHWHMYVCEEILRLDKKLKVAKQHYNSKLLFQYFYQWRSLPAVILLERAKEEKKRKWREKVMEILPDYKPPQDS